MCFMSRISDHILFNCPGRYVCLCSCLTLWSFKIRGCISAALFVDISCVPADCSSCYQLLTPRSRVRLETLTGSRLVKRFPAFYGIPRFITTFTSARHLSPIVTTKLNPVALVRERTIPTERPPPVGEVSANFLRIEGCHVVSATDPHGR